jgi:uncharacterized protein (TIGR01777 family)
MKALITGATGLIGRRLVERLEQPIVLSRDAERAKAALGEAVGRVFAWNPSAEPAPADAFEGVDVVFNLAGESVGEGRWTKARKQRILDSRVLGTRHLVETIRGLDRRPRVLVSASAIGFYGPCGDEVLDESAPAGSDFLAEVCQAWEAEAAKARDAGLRVVCARIGVVMATEGGALEKMLTPFKLGLGGRLSHGRQITPWVHVDDVVGLLMHAAETEVINGPMNTTAPTPVSNREFTSTLARALRRPAIFPMPAFVLKLLLGEFAEAVLASQRVIPKRAQETGYEFRHPRLEDALKALLEAK